MYEGYRLKINGNEVPNADIAKGTYSLKKDDRVIDSYEDMDKVTHEVVSKKPKVTISFSLRKHTSEEHERAVKLTSVKQNLSVEYFDDDTNSYVVGLFKMEVGEYSHAFAGTQRIFYNETPIKLIEY